MGPVSRRFALTAALALAFGCSASGRPSGASAGGGGLGGGHASGPEAAAVHRALSNRDEWLGLFAPEPGPQALAERLWVNLNRLHVDFIGDAGGGRWRVVWRASAATLPVSDVVAPEMTDGRIVDVHVAASRPGGGGDTSASADTDGVRTPSASAGRNLVEPSVASPGEGVVDPSVASRERDGAGSATSARSGLVDRTAPTRAGVVDPSVASREGDGAGSATSARSGLVDPTAPTQAGVVDAGSVARPVAPIWLVEELFVTSRGGVTLVAAVTVPEASRLLWLDAGAAALDSVGKAGLGPLVAPSAAGRSLVLLLPGSLVAYAAVTGGTATSAIGTAAETQGGGPEEQPLVVINGVANEGVTNTDAGALVLHEAVHAVTSSPHRSAPLWVEEGLAESVASRSYPTFAARNARRVREALAASNGKSGGSLGISSAADRFVLPTDEQLGKNGSDGQVGYALAQVAVESCMARWGRTRFLGWAADWTRPDRPSEANLLDCFRTALARVR